MKKLMFVFVLLCSVAIIPGKAVAISLTLEPWLSVVNPGQSAYLNLRVSGLTVGGPPSLGGFDVEVTYNDTILDFETVWFSNWLGNTSPISFETDIFVGDTIPG
ncbi:MAG: hypothetical protein GY737_10610, partial [Desulfobacteraceae bacterium]|nr:hypothetical protein [Desulfobacteraceae bacterium]